MQAALLNTDKISRARRRQSDARWRASVASCYETLRLTIPMSKRATRKHISKSRVLLETANHMDMLQNILRGLLIEKAQTTDVNEKEAWADAQVEEINKEFCIKQRQVLESIVNARKQHRARGRSLYLNQQREQKSLLAAARPYYNVKQLAGHHASDLPPNLSKATTLGFCLHKGKVTNNIDTLAETLICHEKLDKDDKKKTLTAMKKYQLVSPPITMTVMPFASKQPFMSPSSLSRPVVKMEVNEARLTKAKFQGNLNISSSMSNVPVTVRIVFPESLSQISSSMAADLQKKKCLNDKNFTQCSDIPIPLKREQFLNSNTVPSTGFSYFKTSGITNTDDMTSCNSEDVHENSQNKKIPSTSNENMLNAGKNFSLASVFHHSNMLTIDNQQKSFETNIDQPQENFLNDGLPAWFNCDDQAAITSEGQIVPEWNDEFLQVDSAFFPMETNFQMHTRTVPISDKLNMNWTSPKQDSNKDIMFSAGGAFFNQPATNKFDNAFQKHNICPIIITPTANKTIELDRNNEELEHATPYTNLLQDSSVTPSKLFPALKMSPFHPAGLTPVSSVTPQTDRGRRPLRNNMQASPGVLGPMLSPSFWFEESPLNIGTPGTPLSVTKLEHTIFNEDDQTVTDVEENLWGYESSSDSDIKPLRDYLSPLRSTNAACPVPKKKCVRRDASLHQRSLSPRVRSPSETFKLNGVRKKERPVPKCRRSLQLNEVNNTHETLNEFNKSHEQLLNTLQSINQTSSQSSNNEHEQSSLNIAVLKTSSSLTNFEHTVFNEEDQTITNSGENFWSCDGEDDVKPLRGYLSPLNSTYTDGQVPRKMFFKRNLSLHQRSLSPRMRSPFEISKLNELCKKERTVPKCRRSLQLNDVGNSREVYNEFNKSHEQFLNILPLTKLATSQSSNNDNGSEYAAQATCTNSLSDLPGKCSPSYTVTEIKQDTYFPCDEHNTLKPKEIVRCVWSPINQTSPVIFNYCSSSAQFCPSPLSNDDAVTPELNTVSSNTLLNSAEN